MQRTASIVVDIRNMRCSSCKVLVRDELAKKCDHCDAVFDSVMSNHVGLAEKLREKRGEQNENGIEKDPEDRYPEMVGG